MAETTIEWTERSWNPIVGCSVVSPGCTNCYAMGMADRFKDVYRGRQWAGEPAEAMTRRVNGKAVWTGQLTLAPDRVLTEPLRRRRPTTWFVNSMGDLFHENTPEAWIDRVVAVMALAELLHLCPPAPDGRDKHIFQVLTKRADRMRSYLRRLPNRDDIIADEADQIMGGNLPVELLVAVKRLVRLPLPNVWFGVSAEDQKRADERVPLLLGTPAAVRFVSAEPLLGPISFRDWLRRGDDDLRESDPLACMLLRQAEEDGTAWVRPALDWIIVGGESGPDARPMHPDWPRRIREQCEVTGTAFFFKQWGEWQDGSDFAPNAKAVTFDGRVIEPTRKAIAAADRDQRVMSPTMMRRVGKKRAGRLLDGIEHNAMPEVAR